MDQKDNREAFAVACLQALPGWTTSQINRALRNCSSFEQILRVDRHRLQISESATKELLRWQNGQHQPLLEQVEQELDRCREADIQLIPSTSDNYPPLLKEISQPPPLLYVRGDICCLALPQLAMVGSRRATRSGLENARLFARELAGSGFCVTSGLALGIDGLLVMGKAAFGKGRAVHYGNNTIDGDARANFRPTGRYDQ